MMKPTNKLFFTIILVVLTVFSCNTDSEKQSLPFFNSAVFTPEWIAVGSPEYTRIHKIAPFKLTNQDGDIITNETYNGKIYVADFFFATCPGICPKLEKNMSVLQEKYLHDDSIKLLSHTVMPTRDSVEVLKDYAIKNDIVSGKWNLVTGDKEMIYDLARTSYFADEDFVKTKDENAFIHTENFILVDPKGRIRGVYNGTISLEIKRLIRHIEMLKKESDL
ncbi:SCO family protein [uncultured Aquimarina sp.]|uniref:SCO family protein n=1 Tax=uncultured Aquimarina sp. TaxID=575652 RepID=UPI002620656F|nr:SCO family protein [uncultured Aquimarina sp.]